MVSPIFLHLDYRIRKHMVHSFPGLCNFNSLLAQPPLQDHAHLHLQHSWVTAEHYFCVCKAKFGRQV